MKKEEKGRNIARIYHKLVSHPVLPLLFLTEMIKRFVLSDYVFTPKVIQLFFLTIGAAFFWSLSDMNRDWYKTIIGKFKEKTIFGKIKNRLK